MSDQEKQHKATSDGRRRLSTQSKARPTSERRSRRVGRLAAAVRNGLEIARNGSLGEREPSSPYEVFATGPHHRLRRYYSGQSPDDAGNSKTSSTAPRPPEGSPLAAAPVILVPPLMLSSELWDVTPAASAVTTLFEAGADPWVVDFGSPEEEEGGLDRSLTDHVLAVAQAVATVREATGQSVHLMGYSQGGMFAYQAAAYLQSEGIASLVTFGSGVDLHRGLPANLPSELVIESIDRFGDLAAALIPDGIPSWATRLGFQLMDPVKTLQQRIDFVRRLSDREALQKREGMRRFMEDEGWTAFPGPALADLLKQLVAQNRLLEGGLVINGKTVTLADIRCPILAFVGLTDSIAPPKTVRAIYAAAPLAEAYQINVPTGHFGLVVGSQANESTWPAVIEWLSWHEDQGPLPTSAQRLLDRDLDDKKSTPLEDLQAVAGLAWDLGAGVVDGAVQGLGDRFRMVGRIANAVLPQLPQLSRLAEIRRTTRISPGLALRERAASAPNDTFFLFEGRAHTYAAADVRIDNIVRGLIACGVRQGQHVGLLMDTRPSAVAAAVALSRLGAVSVLLRPDLPLAAQLEIARAEHLLCDPEHAEAARQEYPRDVLVLGGGGDPRTLRPGLVDMEAIDPEAVEMPDWFESDPGRAGEVALVLITGHGDKIGMNRVSNRRWATSAYGTATSCALTPQDTVYCCSPTHHPTGILVCVGGALVSGARLAMASEFGPTLHPEVFWHDVRRYGVNVVFYSGSLCRVLVNAVPNQQERHHAIRLFAGSGMPKSIWRRLIDRFGPVDVVEFFASSEGNAVLVNLTGKKIGSLGRPLPGAGQLDIAAWDMARGRLVESRSGFAGRCAPSEVGLLVERFDRERGELERRPLRNVFEAGDAWIDTRDLVRVDADGDYWLVDYVADVAHVAGRSVTTVEIEELLTARLESLDLAAVYGVRLPDMDEDVLVASVTLRPGEALDPVALRRVVTTRLAAHKRPLVVRVLASLPMTAGHRTRKRKLRRQGLGLGHESIQTLWLAPEQAGYVPLQASGDIGELGATGASGDSQAPRA